MDIKPLVRRPAFLIFLIGLPILTVTTTPAYAQANPVGALEFISRIGTPDDGALDLFYENNLLYVANKFTGLQILDVTDFSAPKILSRTPSSGQNYSLTKSGNYVYMTDLLSGLLVYDVSNPKKPRKVAEMETKGEAWDVKIKDNLAYLAVGKAGLQIVDITDPTKPTPVSSLWYEREWDYARKVFIAESGILFVADRKSGIHLVDISNPQAPRAIRRYGTQFASGVYVDGTTAYVADGPNGLLILDVSNPDKIRTLAEFKLPGHANDVVKAGRYAYVAVDDAGIRSIDVTTPARPTFDARYDTPGQAFKVMKHDIYVMVADLSSVLFMIHNRPPVLAKVGNKTVAENQKLEFKVRGDDPDGNPVFFGAHFLPEGATFNAKDSLFTWTPSFEQSGVYQGIIFSITENTQTKLFSRDTIAITVTHVNRVPALASTGNYTVDENQKLTIAINPPSDPDVEDDGKLKVSASGLPEGAVFDAAKLQLDWTPNYDQSGKYTLTFTVTDGAGGTDSKTTTITVNHVNRPPVFADLNARFTVDENAPLSIKIDASDPDKEDAGKLDVTAYQLPQGARFDKATQTVSWTPTYEQSGDYSGLTFIVKDPAGLSDTVTTSITVNHVNRPPVFTVVAAQQVDENKPLTFVLAGSDPDKEDAGKLVISTVSVPEGASFDAATNTFTWTPTYDQSGSFTPGFRITDPPGAFAELTVNVTVRNVNRPPTIAAVEAQTGDENKELRITIPEAVDPDKEDVGKLVYTAENLPRGATFDAATRVVAWTPTYDQSGNYPGVKVTVKDVAGLTASTTFAITINHVNRPPVLNDIAAQTVDEQKLLTFVVTGSDPDKEDAGKFTFSAEGLPEGAAFDAATRRFSWTPTFEQAGAYTVTFKVEDPSKASESKTATITVNNVNRGPKLAQLTAINGEENKELVYTVPDGEDPDKEDVGKLVYTMTNLPAGASFDAASKTLKWAPGFDQAGTFTITASVKDAAGLSDSKPLSVKIANTNRPPALTDRTESGEEGKALKVTIDATDPDKEDQGRLSVKAEGLPQGAVFTAANRTLSWTPTYDQSGEYSVKLTVTDAGGLTDTKTLTIKIANTNRKPTLGQMANQSGTEESNVTFKVTATDPDKEDKLTFSSTGLPDGASLSSDGQFSWTPSAGQAGSYSITIEVSDGNLKDSKSVSINIKAKAQ